MSHGSRNIQVERASTCSVQPKATGSRADSSMDRVPADKPEDDGHHQHWAGNQAQGLESQTQGRQSRSDLHPRCWLADEFQSAKAWRWPEQNANHDLPKQQQARRVGQAANWHRAEEHSRRAERTTRTGRIYSGGTIHDVSRTRHTLPTRQAEAAHDGAGITKESPKTCQRHAACSR